jgi:hypothetical protein
MKGVKFKRVTKAEAIEWLKTTWKEMDELEGTIIRLKKQNEELRKRLKD